jgi:hypothetical protein
MQLIEEEGNDGMNSVGDPISKVKIVLIFIDTESVLIKSSRNDTADKRKLLQNESTNIVQDINLKKGNDNILPFEFLSKKKARILKKAAQPSFW